jgi:hypothetical protein
MLGRKNEIIPHMVSSIDDNLEIEQFEEKHNNMFSRFYERLFIVQVLKNQF